jgi:hypothetical protein
MAKINGPDGVLEFAPPAASDGTQWTPFTDATQIEAVRAALRILRDKVATIPTCDEYFRGLPGGRTFAEVLDDPYVWISYDPSGPDDAETVGKHVAISKHVLAIGRWAVATTLVHEFAHVNGASDVNGQAEKALAHCGLKANANMQANTLPKSKASYPIPKRPTGP